MTKVFYFSTEWLIRIAIASIAAWWAYESAVEFWDYPVRILRAATAQSPFANWSLLLGALKWLAYQTIAISVGGVALGHPALAALYLIAGGVLIQVPLLIATVIFCIGILGLVALWMNTGLILLVVATVLSAAVLYGAIFFAIGFYAECRNW